MSVIKINISKGQISSLVMKQSMMRRGKCNKERWVCQVELLAPFDSKSIVGSNSQGLVQRSPSCVLMFTLTWKQLCLPFLAQLSPGVVAVKKVNMHLEQKACHSLKITSFLVNVVALPLVDTLRTAAPGDSCPPGMCADGIKTWTPPSDSLNFWSYRSCPRMQQSSFILCSK